MIATGLAFDCDTLASDRFGDCHQSPKGDQLAADDLAAQLIVHGGVGFFPERNVVMQ